MPFFSSKKHNAVFENGKKISRIGYYKNGKIDHKSEIKADDVGPGPAPSP